MERRGDIETAFDLYKTVPTPFDVVDELLPKSRQRPLDFKNLLCVARKPSVTAAGFDVAPDDARERRSDRFDQDAFDPAVEGNLTRWRYVSILAMPELTCPRCRKIFPEGMLICLACGLSLATMSDMRRACQIFRLEELAGKLGFELTLVTCWGVTMSLVQPRAACRQIRSAAAVLKNHARSYMKQARKSGMTFLQRLGTDAHYAFNCAVQDLSPNCMHWITVLAAYAVLPIGDRFEVLSEANTTFQSLAMSKQDVYADILSYVDNILRPLTEAKDTEGGSRPLLWRRSELRNL